METVEIFDLDESYEGGVLSVYLKDVLSCVSEEEKNYQWIILDLHGARGNLSPMTTIPELEDSINCSPHGIEFSWEELLEIANKLEDAIEVCVVGNKQKKRNNPQKNFDEHHRNNDITFELFDREFWIITSSSDSLMQRIKNKFHDVRPATLCRVFKEEK